MKLIICKPWKTWLLFMAATLFVGAGLLFVSTAWGSDAAVKWWISFLIGMILLLAGLAMILPRYGELWKFEKTTSRKWFRVIFLILFKFIVFLLNMNH
jgi:formate/nitrite transporter FocA (FNT family)